MTHLEYQHGWWWCRGGCNYLTWQGLKFGHIWTSAVLKIKQGIQTHFTTDLQLSKYYLTIFIDLFILLIALNFLTEISEIIRNRLNVGRERKAYTKHVKM